MELAMVKGIQIAASNIQKMWETSFVLKLCKHGTGNSERCPSSDCSIQFPKNWKEPFAINKQGSGNGERCPGNDCRVKYPNICNLAKRGFLSRLAVATEMEESTRASDKGGYHH
jgi:hypothetical protein